MRLSKTGDKEPDRETTEEAGREDATCRSRLCPLTGMDRGAVILGTFLILLGVFFLAAQWVPGFREWLGPLSWERGWPLVNVGVGLLLLIIGMVQRVPEMAVPFAVLSGLGLLLYWQNLTGNWHTWSYLWTLIPGFVGIGIILAGVMGDKPRRSLRQGTTLIFISLILLAIFGSLLGGVQIFGPYWPVLLIALGLWTLAQGALRRR